MAAGLRVAWEGNGPVVVMLPSLGRPAADLARLATALRAAGYRTALADLHGIGGSPPLPPGGSLRDIAADVLAAIGACDEPVAVVGHAFGNRVARCMAADRPDRVRSLVLLGCGGRVPGAKSALAALTRCFDASLSEAEHLSAVADAFFAPGHDPAVWRDGWHAAAAQAQRHAGTAIPVEHWWLPPAPLPVLALVGADDRVSPPANALSLAAALGERGRAEVIPDAGHALLPEQPEAVATAVIGWLKERDGRDE